MDFNCGISFLITRAFSPTLRTSGLLLIWVCVFMTSLAAQDSEAIRAINELRQGTLIVRFPTQKAKIDTLTSLVARSKDPRQKQAFEKELQETLAERDSLIASYSWAFKNKYSFSKAAYFFDYDSRDLNTARYYNFDGERIAVGDISDKPLYYLFFDRTEENKMDALVIQNRFLKKVPRPFPNDFTTGGINVLFLKLAGKKMSTWRVEKMNKRLFAFWETYKTPSSEVEK